MMRKMIVGTILLAALIVTTVPQVQAACTPNIPSVVYVGESYCWQVCASRLYTREMIGDVMGPGGTPVMILQPGCNSANSNCDFTCTALTPPTDFVWGLPSWSSDSVYYASNSCFEIDFIWGHDGTWWITVHTKAGCTGCFCMTFDHQLAVNLSRELSATASDHQVKLSWTTASETNNDHFEIVRDGQSVGSVPGLGTSSSGKEYSWTDSQVQIGMLYRYSLVSVDLNGARKTLGTVNAMPSLTETGTVSSYALYQNYPNPFNPNTQISFDVLDPGFVTLKVYNPLGAEVATLVNGEVKTGRHSVTFDGRDLTSGIYFYSVRIGDKFTATRKMLLVK